MNTRDFQNFSTSRRRSRRDVVAAWFGVALMAATTFGAAAQVLAWTEKELRDIHRMSLANLQPLPPNPSNRIADDPRAAALGEALFSDARFSADGTVACATCHQPDRQFQDDLKVGHGMADATRRTMPLAGVAFHPFFFWDGRKDSLWSQALGPLENPLEHGTDRTMVAQLIAANYRAEYEALFGSLPDFGELPAQAAPAGSPEAVAAWAALSPDQQRSVNLTFANMGKAIEAFERTIPVPVTRFDAFAAALDAQDGALADTIFSAPERNGLKIFLGQGDCVRCHGGPHLTDLRFHNLGLPGTTEPSDGGRILATHLLADDPFNCLGAFSDAHLPRHCLEVKLLRHDMPDQLGAFKSPSLRGVAQRPPYMHTGQFATLRDVLVHYNAAPKAPFGATELTHPLKLTEAQLSDLEAFLHTLDVGDTTRQ